MACLSLHDYRCKVLGCWLGKNIGGTLGEPFEWRRQVNDVSFYTQSNLNGQPMPNDDLDIQLLWLCALEECGIQITAQRLAEYWMTYVTPHWAEYGMAKMNMRQGLLPPLSGSFNNAYKHSCGAYIRSEIWACIAPGLPRVAAAYAYEDAAIDHGDGEGVLAEVFMAALESAAFFVSDLRALIEIGLSYIPADSGVAQAVQTTLACYDAGKTWLECRDEILRLHRGSTFAGNPACTSPRDRALGFHTGTLGYDVPSNIALTLVGLLYGGDDFGNVQCIAVNCGEDTDCTAATAGSVWGIIHGADAIPQKWIDPIGRGIKTVCLNLGELGHFGGQLPKTVDELTDRTIHIAQQVLLRHRAQHLVFGEQSDLSSIKPDALKADQMRLIVDTVSGQRFNFDGFRVALEYGEEGPLIRDGQPKTLGMTIRNTGKIQANLSIHWYLPEGWSITPSADCYIPSLPGQHRLPIRLEFSLAAERVTRTTSRAVCEITIEGRPTVMLVPVVLLNGNILPESPMPGVETR